MIQELSGAPRVLPSATTICRHRLTIHVSWIGSLRAEVGEALILGSVVRYQACDLTPQDGRDWLIAASSAKAPTAFDSILRLAGLVHDQPRGGDNGDDPEDSVDESSDAEKDLVSELGKLLHWRRGSPIDLGSGRTGRRYKFRASAHPMRLVSYSWNVVARLLSDMACWITDICVDASLRELA